MRFNEESWTEVPFNHVESTTRRKPGRWPRRTCIVTCECGHESRGHFFGAVWLGGLPWRWDAWVAHRRHAERVHCTDYNRRVRLP